MTPPSNAYAALRAETLFQADYQRLLIRTDRLFGGIMLFQWFAAVAAALIISPRTWSGMESSLHPHVLAAFLLGGLITLMPVACIYLYPGRVFTRHVVAVSQMLMSALLIHLSGGRIETHFHVFGSLAFLAIYRDWRVLVSASIVVAADHCLRGIYWPQSVFGVITASNWRWVEHAAWVVFEDIFLIASCVQSIRDMKNVALRHAELESSTALIEEKVRKRTAELAEHRRLLEATAQARTRELEDALSQLQITNNRLEQANHHRGQFLSMMSHELRTPLHAILGFSGLLEDRGFGPLNEKQAEYVERITTGGKHLLDLINEVIDLARIDVGDAKFDMTKVDGRAAIESTINLVKPEAAKRNVDIRLGVAPGASLIRADERRFKQVVLNLLSNAIKYAPEYTDVDVRIENAPGGVMFSVRDRGIGIAPENQERIFEEFLQADRKRDEALGGIGIGLALSKRIVEMHDGRMGVKSALGEGATFWFVMPGASLGEDGRESRGDSLKCSVLPKLVLVVDDNDAHLGLVVEVLAGGAYEVLAARNGREAVEAAVVQRPDAVLVNVRLPIDEGIETIQALRALDSVQDVPVIAMAAASTDGAGKACLAAGCNAVVRKPVAGDDLLAILGELVPGDESYTVYSAQ